MFHASNPPAWTGPTGYYKNDYRAPLTPDQGLTFSPIHLWATPEYADAEMYLSILADPEYLPPADRTYSLELLYVPNGITDAPRVGTRWDVPLDRILTVAVPTFRDKEGAKAYQFAFTMSEVVPEPMSLALLLLGAAFGPRQRRGIRGSRIRNLPRSARS